jgi:hypothetical protein
MWSLLKNVNIELPYNLTIPFRGMCPEEMKARAGTGICTRVFTGALYKIVKRQR